MATENSEPQLPLMRLRVLPSAGVVNKTVMSLETKRRYLARPLDRQLGFLVVTLPQDQARRDPIRQQKRLKLAARERICEVTNQAIRELV